MTSSWSLILQLSQWFTVQYSKIYRRNVKNIYGVVLDATYTAGTGNIASIEQSDCQGSINTSKEGSTFRLEATDLLRY